MPESLQSSQRNVIQPPLVSVIQEGKTPTPRGSSAGWQAEIPLVAMAGLLELQQQGAQVGHLLVDCMDFLLWICPFYPGISSSP